MTDCTIFLPRLAKPPGTRLPANQQYPLRRRTARRTPTTSRKITKMAPSVSDDKETLAKILTPAMQQTHPVYPRFSVYKNDSRRPLHGGDIGPRLLTLFTIPCMPSLALFLSILLLLPLPMKDKRTN